MSKAGNPAAVPVLWGKVCALAGVQGAIALAWVIYNLYLVQLLTQLGFAELWATLLLVVENLLAMVMEPLMGTLSDRMQHTLGTRLPLISFGMVASAALFFIIPLTVMGGGPVLRWVMIAVVVTWAIAMTVFRSPALSLLGRYAFQTQLPQAASVLTLVGGVAGAMGPLAGNLLLSLGAIATFGVGAAVLLIAAVVLSWAKPEAAIATESRPETLESSTPFSLAALPWQRLGLVFGAGVGVTLGFRLLMMNFPAVLSRQVPDAPSGLIMGTIFVALALTALPMGQLAVQLGNRRAMIVGLAGMAFICAAIATTRSTGLGFAIAIAIGAAFSLVSNGTIPFALSMVPPSQAALGTGIYFSGGALASSLFGLVAAPIRTLPPSLGAAVGGLAFLLAGVCVAGTIKRR